MASIPARSPDAPRSSVRIAPSRRLGGGPRSWWVAGTILIIALVAIPSVVVGSPPSWGLRTPAGTGRILAVSPDLSWTAPFVGFTVSNRTAGQTNGCGTNESLAVPWLNTTSGLAPYTMVSTANNTACTSSGSYTDFQEYVSLTTKNFSVNQSGLYVVRFNWHWAWSTLFVNVGAQATTYFEFAVSSSACDVTTGICAAPPAFATSYSIAQLWNTTETQNGTFRQSSTLPLSFPLSLPLTRGELYSSTLTVWVRCYSAATGTTPMTSTSTFSLSTASGDAVLRSVTVNRVG